MSRKLLGPIACALVLACHGLADEEATAVELARLAELVSATDDAKLEIAVHSSDPGAPKRNLQTATSATARSFYSTEAHRNRTCPGRSRAPHRF